jgi:hypothetical protein
MNNEELAKVKAALETGVDLAAAHADETHRAYAGYKPDRHAAVDRDVADMREALGIVESWAPATAAGTIDTPIMRYDHVSGYESVVDENDKGQYVLYGDHLQHVAAAVAQKQAVIDYVNRQYCELEKALAAEHDEVLKLRAATAPVSAAPTRQQIEDARGEGWIEGAGMMAKAYLEDVESAGASMHDVVDDLRRLASSPVYSPNEIAETMRIAAHTIEGLRAGFFNYKAIVADPSSAGAPVSAAGECPDPDFCRELGCNLDCEEAAPVSAASIDGQMTEAPSAVKQPGGQELPALPEMDDEFKMAHLLTGSADWDEDYRATWTKLQVAERNKMQWRKYALELRALLATRQPQVQVTPTETGFTITIPGTALVAAKQAGKEGGK